MNNPKTKLFRACAIACMVLGSGTVLADEFVLTFNVPVNVTRVSPNVTGVLLACTVYNHDGTENKNQIPSEDCCGYADIDGNRSFHGTLQANNHYDLATAQKIDWGTYTCNVRFNANNTSPDVGYPSVSHPNPNYRAQTGSVTQVSGKLY